MVPGPHVACLGHAPAALLVFGAVIPLPLPPLPLSHLGEGQHPLDMVFGAVVPRHHHIALPVLHTEYCMLGLLLRWETAGVRGGSTQQYKERAQVQSSNNIMIFMDMAKLDHKERNIWQHPATAIPTGPATPGNSSPAGP